jgi:iron complex transport system substrate-binding protein
MLLLNYSLNILKGVTPKMNIAKLSALILALILVLSLAACAPNTAAPDASASPSPSATPSAEPSPSAADTAVTVTDMMGREVKLDAPATKVVALTAADCEILYAIGAGSTVVGRGEYCDYPEEVLSVASITSGDDTNAEQIIALTPDVVIMSEMAQTQEQIDALENAGVRVLVTNADSIDGTYEAIELIGAVVGKTDEATALVDSMKQVFDEISEKATGDGTQMIYFEVSPLEYGLWTAGSGTFMDELATMVGLKNAFADVEGWAEISQEQVIERNPDFIVTTTMSYDDASDPVQEILGRDGWQDVTAVKNAAVMQSTNHDEMTRPGPRLVDAVNSLYAFVYENKAAAPAASPAA